MPDMMQNRAGGTVWGVAHAQGIRWCGSEKDARHDMAWMVAADGSRQATARGKVRLVRRLLGPVEVVENPYGDIYDERTVEQ